MGGPTSRDIGSRRHRGGSQLRLDVWSSQSTASKPIAATSRLSPKRVAMGLSMCAPSVVAPADGAMASECSARVAGHVMISLRRVATGRGVPEHTSPKVACDLSALAVA